jgi:two-component system chemotaxis sensor kinase CheA
LDVDDLLRDFLAESAENLAQLDRDVVELEREPSNTELLHSIFRTIHTIKGTCGFLGLHRLEAISHTTESVLDLLRQGVLRVSPEVVSDILRAVDVIKTILAGLEAREREPVGDDSLLIGILETWLAGEPAPEAQAWEPGLLDPLPSPVAAPPTAEAPSVTPSVAVSDDAREPVRDAADVAAHAPAGVDAAAGVAASSLRVSIAVLDSLMNLAGELVLTRNQLLEICMREEGSQCAGPVQQLSRITAELQSVVMKTRMQAVGSAWGKLPRLVRDIARETDKKIELELRGADTELDRQLVQALQDPLTHMVRNSADHGIEPPAVRLAAGKPEVGTISLNAYHESGNVIVEIVDDGAGIDAARVRAKAIERGLVRREVAEGMSDSQVLRYIFEPGFSTADAVTHLSGRGVGMDVVRSNIERVGGTVELHSTRGQGCTVRVKLPLTLAIVSALLVSTGGESFAIPQSCITELVRFGGAERGNIADLHGIPLFRLRDELVPVIGLSALLGLHTVSGEQLKTLVICHVGSCRFGVVVDEVLDTQEIVVKPIGRRVRHLTCYSGCTILGDGRVIMILDPAGVAAMGGMQTAELRATEPEARAAGASGAAAEAYLLFDGGSTAPQAVPLSRVARLEEVPTDRIEHAGGRMVVQYRGGLLPIVTAPGVTLTAGQSRAVIVFTEGTSSFGLAVNEIRDIVEDQVQLDLGGNRPGVLGTTVVAGAATEVLDIGYLFARSRGEVA